MVELRLETAVTPWSHEQMIFDTVRTVKRERRKNPTLDDDIGDQWSSSSEPVSRVPFRNSQWCWVTGTPSVTPASNNQGRSQSQLEYQLALWPQEYCSSLRTHFLIKVEIINIHLTRWCSNTNHDASDNVTIPVILVIIIGYVSSNVIIRLHKQREYFAFRKITTSRDICVSLGYNLGCRVPWWTTKVTSSDKQMGVCQVASRANILWEYF